MRSRRSLQDALGYYLKANDYRQAEAILERAGNELIRMGRLGDLSEQLQSFPAEMIQKNPWLLYFHCVIHRLKGSQEVLANLEKALSLFEQQESTKGQLLVLASLIEACRVRGHNAPVLPLIEKSEKLLEAARKHDCSYERAVLSLQVGFGHVLMTGNLRRGVAVCHDAFLLAKEIENVSLEISALINMHWALSALGELKEAQKIITQVDRLFERHVYPELQAWHNLYASLIGFFSGDLVGAEGRLRAAQEQIASLGLTYLYPVSTLYEIFLHTLCGRYGETENLGNQLIGIAKSVGNEFLQALALQYMGWNCYRKGEYGESGSNYS